MVCNFKANFCLSYVLYKCGFSNTTDSALLTFAFSLTKLNVESMDKMLGNGIKAWTSSHVFVLTSKEQLTRLLDYVFFSNVLNFIKCITRSHNTVA